MLGPDGTPQKARGSRFWTRPGVRGEKRGPGNMKCDCLGSTLGPEEERARGQLRVLRATDPRPTLKCGKIGHRAANCPNKPQQAQLAEEDVTESAPFICYTEMALATGEPEAKLSTMEAIKQGYCVIDGGATRTLGSMAALQAVLDKNQAEHGEPRLLQVDTERRPRFSFGNSTEGKCSSTVELGIKAGAQDGRLTVHALDEGMGPILFSVSTLRSLGAIIDFEHDLLAFRKLSDRHVIPLKQSQNGHQLLQLTKNLYENAETATSAIPSLKQFLP